MYDLGGNQPHGKSLKESLRDPLNGVDFRDTYCAGVCMISGNFPAISCSHVLQLAHGLTQGRTDDIAAMKSLPQVLDEKVFKGSKLGRTNPLVMKWLDTPSTLENASDE